MSNDNHASTRPGDPPGTDPPPPAPAAPEAPAQAPPGRPHERFDLALAAALRRPVAAEEVRFKIQRAGEHGAVVVAYIDARTVIARLNRLVPGRWSARHRAVPLAMRLTIRDGAGRLVAAHRPDPRKAPVPDPSLWYECRLRILGARFEDAGAGEDPKAARADSLKRAAVRAGVGEALYAFRVGWLAEGQAAGELRRQGGSQGRLAIDAATERALRERYRRWLEASGEQAFGPVLAHGPGGQEAEADEGPQASADPDGDPSPVGGQVDEAGAADQTHQERAAVRAGYRRLAEAARVAGDLDAASVAALGWLMLARPSAGGVGELPLGEERFLAGMAETLGLVGRARWGAETLAGVIARAQADPRPPLARREAFLTHLATAVAAEEGRKAA